MHVAQAQQPRRKLKGGIEPFGDALLKRWLVFRLAQSLKQGHGAGEGVTFRGEPRGVMQMFADEFAPRTCRLVLGIVPRAIEPDVKCERAECDDEQGRRCRRDQPGFGGISSNPFADALRGRTWLRM